MVKREGTCALCGSVGSLSFEHIPPRAAFNSSPAKPIKGQSVLNLVAAEDRKPWELSGLPYLNQQQGAGDYTLCAKCNNLTGAYYGNDYCGFAVSVAYGLRKLDASTGNTLIMTCEFYPARFIKQVISLFCSVNNKAIVDDNYADLRRFVLDKNMVGIDRDKYRFYLYALNGGMEKRAPFTALLFENDGVFHHEIVSEIAAFPLGLIFALPPFPKEDPALDITSFGDYAYDTRVKAEIPLSIRETNVAFPLDYRSKEEVDDTIKKNKADSNTVDASR